MNVESERVTLRIPPRPEYVSTARIVAASFARYHAFAEGQIDDLKVVVSEAVTNSIRAHNAARVAEPIELALQANDDGVIVEVSDRGRGSDVSLQDDASEFSEGGLGLTVIRALFAETSLERNAGDGTRLRVAIKRETDSEEPLR